MSQQYITGSDTVKSAFLDSTGPNFNDLYSAISALTVGTGCPVSSNDALPGYLNGKLVAGDGITLTEGSDGGDETLTIAITKPVTAKTSNYTVTSSDLAGDTIFTNTGASGEVTLTLPTSPVAGYEAEYEVTAAQYLKILAADDKVISYVGSDTAANGYIRSNTAGCVVKIRYNGTKWTINKIIGSWSYDQ